MAPRAEFPDVPEWTLTDGEGVVWVLGGGLVIVILCIENGEYSHGIVGHRVGLESYPGLYFYTIR